MRAAGTAEHRTIPSQKPPLQCTKRCFSLPFAVPTPLDHFQAYARQLGPSVARFRSNSGNQRTQRASNPGGYPHLGADFV